MTTTQKGVYTKYLTCPVAQKCSLANSTFVIKGLRVIVWVISDLFEHTGKDFQSQVLFIA